jgi:hypothetical protein
MHENDLYHCPKVVPCRPSTPVHFVLPCFPWHISCFHPSLNPRTRRCGQRTPLFPFWLAPAAHLCPAPVAQWPGLLPWSPRLPFSLWFLTVKTNGRPITYLVPRVDICPLSVFASASCYVDSPVTSEEPIIEQIFDR